MLLSPPSPSFTTPAQEQVLGGFHLVNEIACGGMATVYLGRRPGLGGFGQAAAIKVIHPHLARDPEFVDMFMDEARIVSCINHPNVCRVIDFGCSDRTHYLAMEYVMGETLHDVLQAMQQRPETEALIPVLLAQVLAQTCEGLHAAHEARDEHGTPLHIVHRDISPQNLMVGYDGAVRVLDFGVASAAERLHTTRNGALKGRLSFMAPEQARGFPVDRRSDVWSLGVVLWEGLSRQRLFKRDTEAETILAVTQDTLPCLEDCGVPVPPRLVRIAMKALEREPAERYPSARDMGLDLARYAASAVSPFGVAEVSRWMERLFGEQIEEKRVALRRAARAGNIPGEAPMEDNAPTTVVEGFRVRERTPTSSAVTTVRQVALDPDTLDGDETSLERPKRLPQFSEKRPRNPLLSRASRVGQLTAAAVLAGALLATWLSASAGELDLKALSVDAGGSASERDTQAPRASAMGPSTELAPEVSSAPSAAAPEGALAKVPSGLVVVATPGGRALVMEDGQRLGMAPGRFTLPIGSHTLQLWPVGRSARHVTRTVKVTRSRPAKIRVAIKR